MKKKVSIVVPIYNVELYLKKCINSIINQTYSNLEIILVDDGSTDRSSYICDELKKLDDRIRVIHKKNGGLSSARNAGLEMATGDYIMFEDSDDWLELDIVENCVKRAEMDDSDVVIFGYNKVDEKNNIMNSFSFGNYIYKNSELSRQLHKRINEMSFGYAWNKLYKLSTIIESKVRNDSRIIDREDLFFNLSLFKHLRIVSYLDSIGYNYLQRSTSLLHNADLARLKGIKYFCDSIMKIELGNKNDEKKVINMVTLHYLSDAIIKNILWNKELTRKEKMHNVRKTVDECSYTNELYYDQDNPKYLNILLKSIKKNKYNSFYYYVKFSKVKQRFIKR